VCRAEGFFPHPSSCKKYYWCLDTPSQGMVAHTFSCPQGLFFNQITDGCDFLRNVNCGDKDTEEKEETKETSEKIETEEVLSEADNEEEDVEDPKSLKDILEIVKAAGGIEGLEKQIADIKSDILDEQAALKDAKTLHASALESLESLEAMCVQGEETWEERKKKRMEEIEALKEALAILEDWQS